MLTTSILTTILYITSSMTATECPNCKHQRCDSTDNCSDGCIPGFAGPKCLKPCPPHCLDSICDYNENTGAYPCLIGCKPGYYGRQCKTPCKSNDENGQCDGFSGTSPDCGGTHSGEKCERSCRSDCDGLACDNRGKCYKQVCIPGRYGADCSTPCESDCEVCHRDTGQCLKLKEGEDVPYSSKSVCDISGAVHMKDYSGYLIAIIILLLIIAAVGIGIFYQNYKYLWKTSRIRIKDDCREVVVIHGQNENLDTRRRTRSSTKR